MSDAVEQMSDEQELNDAVDADQLAEAGASNSEETTQVESEAEQVEVELVDLSTLTGTQPEKTEKEHNNIYAANRIKAKKLKELEAKIAAGDVPQEHAYKPEAQSERPKLSDFTNEERLYDEFGGNAEIALAAFNEAKEDWQAHGSTVESKRAAHNESLASTLQVEIAKEEAFSANIESFRGSVKGIDESLKAAEDFYGEQVFNNLRDAVGDNAPLVLAVLGSNNAEREALASAGAGGDASIIRHLTRLEDRITANLPSVNKISKANTETPLGGGNTDTSGNLQTKIDKAASSGNVDEYQRLKKIQQGLN